MNSLIITVHDELKMYFSIHVKLSWKIIVHGYRENHGRFTRNLKRYHFTFRGKKGCSLITKSPFPTIFLT